MRYVAAYLLAVLGGKPAPTTQDVEKILGSIGMEFDTAKVKIVVDKLAGKAIDEVIAEGTISFDTPFSLLIWKYNDDTNIHHLSFEDL